jgi:fumarylacetoacetate (FAA) hydrolase
MKLATIRDGTRDGSLVVVSRDLKWAAPIADIAPTMQSALDDWKRSEPALREASEKLERGQLSDVLLFDQSRVLSPLPRAYQWCDGSAYLSHAELVRKARNAEMPQSLYADPLMYQGGSDILLGARDPIAVADESWGIDLEAELAIVTDDVPMGVGADEARDHIVLLMLVNDVSLRNLMPTELAKQFGFFQSKPPTAFSPVAVTPDELGPAWDGSKLSLPLISLVNGRELGRPSCSADLNFDFLALIAHAAKTRPLSAGTIIGSGTVSNRDRTAGSSCLAERRMIEIVSQGAPVTPFLAFGDTVKIEMLDAQNQSIFGAIEQTVVKYERPARQAQSLPMHVGKDETC